jgi:monothiol glutaredoxin
MSLTRLSTARLASRLPLILPALRISFPSLSSFSSRSFSSSGVSDSSHSDFEPKRKSVPSATSTDDIHSLIDHDVKNHPVFLYMKGSPSMPRCGFSGNLVRILQHLNAEFSSRDVLESNELREAVKKYSEWPTFPQLFVKGELIGGSDIVSSLMKSGELTEILKNAGAIKQ